MPGRNRKDVTANQQINELNQYSPVIIRYSVTADATGGLTAFVAPFAMTIAEFQVIGQAASASGTITPRKGTDAMCTAITMSGDGTVARVSAGLSAANIGRLTLAKGDTVTVVTNGATDRGIITFTGVRV